jgi:hypothetical protein
MRLPEGWTAEVTQGPGPFVTRARLRRPDGEVVHWRSRRHRKTSRALNYWMAGLFAIGSLCFAVASILSQWKATSGPGVGVTFFVGSLFFTSAAYLQWTEAVNAAPTVGRVDLHRRWRPASWEPRRIDWLASLVQLAGTVFFNISTFAAMKHGLDVRQQDLRVWTPDLEGSVCFLVASVLAYAEVCGRWIGFRVRSLSWWVVAINLLGSIWFGAATIGAIIDPKTNEPLAAGLNNGATALGAVCFFIGAVLLVPEARRT